MDVLQYIYFLQIQLEDNSESQESQLKPAAETGTGIALFCTGTFYGIVIYIVQYVNKLKTSGFFFLLIHSFYLNEL
jgi:hypothetical protein